MTTIGSSAAATTDPTLPDPMGTWGPPVVSLFLDTLSTLSWATPAGPYVSAFVGILQAIAGDTFGQKPDLLGTIKNITDDAVKRIEYFEENQPLQQALGALGTFSAWIHIVEIRLNTQSRETFAEELTKENGILSHLNAQLGAWPLTLFDLRSKLLSDPDLAQGDPYDSPGRWYVASAKLHLLFLAMSSYLTALKLTIVLTARLYESGYDIHGNRIESTVSNPDNTFSVLIDEMKTFKEKLPGLIANVRARRGGMVTLEVADCLVAYSIEQKPVANRDDWKSMMNRHDALYRGSYHDQLVRSMEDGPTMEQFEWTDNDVMDAHGRGYRRPPTINQHWWKRTEIRDKAVYDGQHPQDWVLSNGDYGSLQYEANTARAEALKAAYLAGILGSLDAWAKAPAILDAGITSLLSKWTPQIPKQLPDSVGLQVAGWKGKSGEGELWSDKRITVRYRFTLRSTIGNESGESDDKTSTQWLEPKGNSGPEIVGLPVQGEYLQFVLGVCVYRQFRKEQPDGSYKYGADRKVAVIERADGQDVFPGRFVDTASASFDQKALADT